MRVSTLHRGRRLLRELRPYRQGSVGLGRTRKRSTPGVGRVVLVVLACVLCRSRVRYYFRVIVCGCVPVGKGYTGRRR